MTRVPNASKYLSTSRVYTMYEIENVRTCEHLLRPCQLKI